MTLKSLDTNILLYAINQDCPEHQPCRALVESALREAEAWMVADQVWFELYRLLRNPAVLKRPLNAKAAADTLFWYRRKSGWLHCAWETDLMNQMENWLSNESFAARRTFDLQLAITLKSNGISQFYTRNVKDFEDLGFFNLINPIA